MKYFTFNSAYTIKISTKENAREYYWE